ncbi:MAG: hypothetical protein LBD48_08895, partial [Treponema sp.]|nr:hypothetical protein [Treponema sp.]
MKPVFETGGLFRGSLLRITFFSGLLLLLLTGGAFLAVYRAGSGAAPRNAAAGFYRLLGDYDRERDTLSAGGTAPDHNAVRRTMETLDRDLDRLEKKAGGVEAWLSVLKRRRELARLDLRFAPAFRQSARRAALAYPYSEPLAAVAAAAVIHGGAITREGEAALRSYLPLLAGSRLERLRLGLHVLLGDFRTPRRAADSLPPDIPPQWVSPALWQTLPSPDAGAIAADLAIVKVLQGDIAAASTVIQEMLSGASTLAALPPPEIIRFAAEFSYDFSAPARSAELFSRLTGDVALSRQADALWLAGYSGSARTIWTMLAPSALSGAGETAAIGVRALYNLALTAETPKESAALLGRLPGLPGTADPPDPAGNRIALMGDLSRRCGLIRYSRFLDAPRAIALLEANKPEEAAPLPGG